MSGCWCVFGHDKEQSKGQYGSDDFREPKVVQEGIEGCKQTTVESDVESGKWMSNSIVCVHSY